MSNKINELKQALFQEYEGFSDKRIKNLSSGSSFIIDDRTDGDIGANKKLYAYFCKMFAKVESKKILTIRMAGNIPKSSMLFDWISENQAEYTEDIFNNLSFDITQNNYGKLAELATIIQNIVKPGARYDTPNYKYVCPRTSESLLRLYKVLHKHWG